MTDTTGYGAEDTADTADESGQPSPADKKFDLQAKRDFMSSAKSPNHIKWREQADEDFEFVAGGSYDDSGQWRKTDIDKLKLQDRPIITMNRLEPLIEGIVGAEVNNRQEVSYQAREPGDTGVAVALLEAGKWARDNNVEEEETDAFRSTIICGMGWTAHSMDYSRDMDGQYQVVSTDPLSHYWDPNAKRPNLVDARWVGYVDIIDRDTFKTMFPGQKGADNVFGVKSQASGADDSTRPEKYPSDYDDPELQGVEGADTTPDQVQVLEYQCYTMEPAFRVLDPATGKLSKAIDKEEFEQLKQAAEAGGAAMVRFGTPPPDPEEGQPLPVVFRYLAQDRRVYYRAFYSGDKRLGERERNPWRNGFTRLCITGRRHRKRGTWYGLVRPMKDPSRFANAFLSAAIHHYNSNPKGGVWYEDGAVDNEDDLEARLAHPAPAIKLNAGGLAKIQPITPAQGSMALDRLIQVVSDMPPLVTGVSLEWLGLASRDQPVGLEQTRKLATLSIVSPIFSSYREYRKIAGRLLFDFIKDYVPQSTLQRVLSADSQPYVQALKDADTLKYDVHVDDAPLSPSIKATVFSSMKDFMQFMAQGLPPAVTAEAAKAFFTYSPLPAQLVAKLVKAMEQAQQPDPMAKIRSMLEMAVQKSVIDKNQAQALLAQAQAQTEIGKPQLEQDKLDMEAADQTMNLMQAGIQAKVAMHKAEQSKGARE